MGWIRILRPAFTKEVSQNSGSPRVHSGEKLSHSALTLDSADKNPDSFLTSSARKNPMAQGVNETDKDYESAYADHLTNQDTANLVHPWDLDMSTPQHILTSPPSHTRSQDKHMSLISFFPHPPNRKREHHGCVRYTGWKTHESSWRGTASARRLEITAQCWWHQKQKDARDCAFFIN